MAVRSAAQVDEVDLRVRGHHQRLTRVSQLGLTVRVRIRRQIRVKRQRRARHA